MRSAKLTAVVVVAASLSACGNTQGERGVTGAGIGAGAGAVIGAVTGLSIASGAVIGAGLGAVTGIITDPSDLNLGEPFWKTGSSRQSARRAGGGTTSSSPLVGNIQAALYDHGYDPGPEDGVAGPQTRAAIKQYQRDNGLLADGRASRELLNHIEKGG